MKLKALVTISLALALTGMAQTNIVVPETDTGKAIRPLALEDCIMIALEHNFDVQIERYSPIASRYDLAGSYGSYEPTLSLSGEHDYSLSPGGVDSQGRAYTGNETENDRFNASLQGLLPWGTTYSLGASMSDQTVTRSLSITDPTIPVGTYTNVFYDATAGQTISLVSTNYATTTIRSPFETVSGSVGALTLRQPLLKNFWIDSTRYQIYANRKSLRISEEAFRSQLMVTVTSVESAYYNLAYAEDSVAVQEKALELAQRLLSENKKRVQVGALAPLDEKQAESQVASSQADLLAAEASRDTAQRVLKNLLSDDYTNDWAGVAIKPTDRLLAMPQEYNLQESWRKGLAQSPALIMARLGLDISKQNVRLLRNQLFPQLDLIGSYGYAGSSDSYDGTFKQLGGGDNPFWTFGAQLSIPLGERSARNSYKAAKASHEQSALKLKQQEQTLLITIENDIASSKTAFERVDATREARAYAEAALEAEQKKLESGKSTSFVVLQLQKDLTTARGSEIRALADYNIAVAQLALDEGTTLERHHIDLRMDSLKANMESPPNTQWQP